MRVFKVRTFVRFQRREQIADVSLVKAVRDAGKGLIDADLGGGLIKQRIARRGGGKSGGYRTVLAYRRGERAVFLYGFPKSVRANIDDVELEVLRRRGAGLLSAAEEALEFMIADDELTEVSYDEEEQGKG
jgi:hypothetical protein